GHGGTDVGAIGTLPDGSSVYEKDINLDIALRLNEYLISAGANVTMLRYDDTSISLYTRPEMANTMGADLYVSVHNNSNEKSSPNGMEVHYYNKEWEAGYGYTSKEIAAEVYRQLVAHQPLKGRDYLSSPKLAVLNKTMMPAIIIEGAFISNESDLAYMMTDEFRENYALAAAIGIINILNASVANQ
ncbi:MAG: N-acetylmuramoyl-L-alanine amidase, partial [Clostridiales bacterium]|nr:N-acetylmuramoyl-L-alanine amidase [Clostridiales bacterium]